MSWTRGYEVLIVRKTVEDLPPSALDVTGAGSALAIGLSHRE